MKAGELRDLLYGVDNEAEVKILNSNAPVKAATEVTGTFKIERNNVESFILMYDSKNGKEGK